jgi:hypothetical protein
MSRHIRSEYEAALINARRDLAQKVEEQEEMEQRAEELKDEIVTLRRIVSGLSDYCGVPNKDFRGLTEVVTEVMDQATGPLDIKEVMAAAQELGAGLGNQKNAAASVASVLNRLAAKGKVSKRATPDGTVWMGPKVG